MNATEELLKAFELLDDVKIEPIEYRIHYDENGITMCSMTNHPVSTSYLVVTEYEYNNYFKYAIVNNKLKKIDLSIGTSVQLTKGNNGYPVVKGNAGILIEPDEVYTSVEYYEDRKY